MISAKTLTWHDLENTRGQFQPYVLPLPVNLWGRDVLTKLNLILTNEYSKTSQCMMQSMGYVPGLGLGKHGQGKTEPIRTIPKIDRKGLGFS